MQTTYQASPLNAFLKAITIAGPKKIEQDTTDQARLARAKRRIQAMISLHGIGKAYHASEDYFNNTPFTAWTEE